MIVWTSKCSWSTHCSCPASAPRIAPCISHSVCASTQLLSPRQVQQQPQQLVSCQQVPAECGQQHKAECASRVPLDEIKWCEVKRTGRRMMGWLLPINFRWNSQNNKYQTAMWTCEGAPSYWNNVTLGRSRCGERNSFYISRYTASFTVISEKHKGQNQVCLYRARTLKWRLPHVASNGACGLLLRKSIKFCRLIF